MYYLLAHVHHSVRIEYSKLNINKDPFMEEHLNKTLTDRLKDTFKALKHWMQKVEASRVRQSLLKEQRSQDQNPSAPVKTFIHRYIINSNKVKQRHHVQMDQSTIYPSQPLNHRPPSTDSSAHKNRFQHFSPLVSYSHQSNLMSSITCFRTI